MVVMYRRKRTCMRVAPGKGPRLRAGGALQDDIAYGAANFTTALDVSASASADEEITRQSSPDRESRRAKVRDGHGIGIEGRDQ